MQSDRAAFPLLKPPFFVIAGQIQSLGKTGTEDRYISFREPYLWSCLSSRSLGPAVVLI